ncbi:expressed unknown protein [Seminavis robusta]|uniref:Uncharacterized protein n=1 Tax=Seminavis robusta TaxID=568900 RepID=A0A9N8ERC0_9STRA|nr:expressed unknown protein [Seminavis robusta]|eukprot:Sro1666_g289730.1 n/a (496) ;mRNA; f:17987-19474
MDLVVRSIELWRARRELSALIWKRRDYIVKQIDPPDKCISLLRAHPQLAGETFRCHNPVYEKQVYPLYFLLICNASVDLIREAYEMFPLAAQHKIKGNFDQTDYLLACGMLNVNEDSMMFLANAYKPAVCSPNSSGYLPIHVLMQNRHHVPTRKVLLTLLDLYESERSNQENDKGMMQPVSMNLLGCRVRTGNSRDEIEALRAPLALAIKRNYVSKDALELLVQRFPKDCKTLRLGRVTTARERHHMIYTLGQESNYRFTKEHVMAIANLLPQLETLCCPAREWRPGAFKELIGLLSGNNNGPQRSSVRDLTIRTPPTNRFSAPDHSALERLLAHNTTLQRLHIDFGGGCPVSFSYGIKRFVAFLLKGLRHNRTLKELRLTGFASDTPPDLLHKLLWPGLAVVLRENLTLSRIDVDDEVGPAGAACASRKQAEYLAMLNRYGRAQFREPSFSLPEIVPLLKSVCGMVEILYGLLRENPSVWTGAISDAGQHFRRI